METVYRIIGENPGYFAWAFGIVNILWVAFIYFNRKQHERELASLTHLYNLDFEKRKRMYEMKASQFEKYFRMVDDFGKRQQVDVAKRLQPIFNQFMEASLAADDRSDRTGSTRAINAFSSQIAEIMNEGMEQYLSLKSETNSLKLIASDELALLFDELQDSYDSVFNSTQEFMGKFIELTMSNNQSEIQRYQGLMSVHGKNIKEKADQLMAQMRRELKEI